MAEVQSVSEIRSRHEEVILAKPNVIGVGTGYKEVMGERTGELCVVAMVRRKLPRAALPQEALVPAIVDGVRTDVQEVGEIKALQARTDRWRPAPGGVSLGHFRITAGTFGCVVRDRATGAHLILSNNHVLANSNDATAGDPILQPGPIDGGREPNDVIARLERFCPIVFTNEPGTCGLAQAAAAVANALAEVLGSHHRFEVIRVDPRAVNRADAAVARPTDVGAIRDDILEIGQVSGPVEAQLGMAVRKSGRSSGLTTGSVNVLDATIDVDYGSGRTARFQGQIVSGPMSEPGDSGSLLVAGDGLQAVGLLFAGSDQVTIFNPIQAVLDCLEVDL
jgi:hypothetical protein